jgi:hypothetical protein
VQVSLVSAFVSFGSSMPTLMTLQAIMLPGIVMIVLVCTLQEPAFQLAVAQRWAALRGRNASASGISDAPLSDAWFKQRFNNYRTQLAFAAPRTYM